MKHRGPEPENVTPVPQPVRQSCSGGWAAIVRRLRGLPGVGAEGKAPNYVMREPSADLMMATMDCLARANERLRGRLEAERRTVADLRMALEQHRSEALTDPLTGLYNRRAMDRCLGDMWARPDAGRLAMLMLDIDYFKRFNDTFGHASGDSVICWVAATLRRCIRAEDYAFRYGGEEFLVLLPNTALEGAVSVAESIRERVETLHLSCPRSLPASLTVSLGVASRRGQDDPISLFARADNALYRAKHGGRNRVVHEGLLA